MTEQSKISLVSDLSGENSWVAFDDAPALVGASLRFISGDPEGNRFRVRYYRDGNYLKARIWFGPETEGPPGHAHGGSIAAVFDEVLGLTAWAAGYPIVVGNLNISFKNMMPIKKVVTLEGKLISAEGRKITVHGKLYCNKTVYAEGEALCITHPEKFAV